MKKLLYLILTLVIILSLLCSCAPPEEPQDPEQPEQPISEPYKFERDKITGISIFGEMMQIFYLSEEENDSLLDLIESLEPKETGIKNDEKGWYYYINISYGEEGSSRIFIMHESITIDGYVYEVTDYSPELFINFFPFPSN